MEGQKLMFAGTITDHSIEIQWVPWEGGDPSGRGDEFTAYVPEINAFRSRSGIDRRAQFLRDEEATSYTYPREGGLPLLENTEYHALLWYNGRTMIPGYEAVIKTTGTHTVAVPTVGVDTSLTDRFGPVEVGFRFALHGSNFSAVVRYASGADRSEEYLRDNGTYVSTNDLGSSNPPPQMRLRSRFFGTYSYQGMVWNETTGARSPWSTIQTFTKR